MSERVSIASNLQGEDLKAGYLETAFIVCLYSVRGTLQQNHLAENTKYDVVRSLNKKIDSCQGLRFWKGYLSQFEFKISMRMCFIIHLHHFMLLFFSLIYTSVPVLVAELLWPSSEYWQGYCRGSSAPGKYCEKTAMI